MIYEEYLKLNQKYGLTTSNPGEDFHKAALAQWITEEATLEELQAYGEKPKQKSTPNTNINGFALEVARTCSKAEGSKRLMLKDGKGYAAHSLLWKLRFFHELNNIPLHEREESKKYMHEVKLLEECRGFRQLMIDSFKKNKLLDKLFFSTSVLESKYKLLAIKRLAFAWQDAFKVLGLNIESNVPNAGYFSDLNSLAYLADKLFNDEVESLEAFLCITELVNTYKVSIKEIAWLAEKVNWSKYENWPEVDNFIDIEADLKTELKALVPSVLEVSKKHKQEILEEAGPGLKCVIKENPEADNDELMDKAKKVLDPVLTKIVRSYVGESVNMSDEEFAQLLDSEDMFSLRCGYNEWINLARQDEN